MDTALTTPDRHADRPAGHRHDVRLVRGADREEAQQGARRRRDRELRDRDRARRGAGRRQPRGARRRRGGRPATACSRRSRRSSTTPTSSARRWRVSAVLTVPVLLLSMVPALQFPGWQWLAFLLASIVVLWGGKPFHRAAWHQRPAPRDDDGHPRVDRRAAAYLWSAVRGAVHQCRRARHDDDRVVAADAATTRRRASRTSTSSRPPSSSRSCCSAAGSSSAPSGAPAPRSAPCSTSLPPPPGCARPPATPRCRPSHVHVGRPRRRAARASASRPTASSSRAPPPIDASMLTGESRADRRRRSATRSPAAPWCRTACSSLRATRVGADTALARITALVTAAQSGKAPGAAARRPRRRRLRPRRPRRSRS